MKKIFFLAIIFSLMATSIIGQNSLYKIVLKDKTGSSYSKQDPAAFLSQDAISRRMDLGIRIQDNDLPVSDKYINDLLEDGVSIILKSKWLNVVVVSINDNEILENLYQKNYIKSIEKVSRGNVSNGVSREAEKGDSYAPFLGSSVNKSYDYGNSFLQVNMIGADSLHELGYNGEGVKVAILDGGFMGVDTIPVFADLFNTNRVLGTKDFVVPGGNVYDHSGHGTAVLSQMGANDPGNLVGTAPGASYYLLRTEDVYAEYLMEEIFWSAGAEYADSAGVKVINSSLGYSEFDNPDENHTYEDLDGQTTPITIAAEVAASKGILVVTSAGNEGDGSWGYITAPADAPNVITVGAVNTSGQYAYFSSYGPTADGRIKPDIVTLGQGNLVSTPTGGMSISSGTSFASPLMAGLAACLVQAYPNRSMEEIRDIIRSTGSQSANPDVFLGYGIANGVGALSVILGDEEFSQDAQLRIYPNPVSSNNELHIFSPNENISSVELFSFSGQTINVNNINISGQHATVQFLSDSPKGIIYLITTTSSSVSVHKVSVL